MLLKVVLYQELKHLIYTFFKNNLANLLPLVVGDSNHKLEL